MSRFSDGSVGVVERRGRTIVAEPFFERGRRVALDRDSRVKPGDLVLVSPVTRGRGHGKVLQRIGRPDVAADVLEALMYDHGLPRRFDPAVEREAKKARARGASPEGRRDLTALPTFTIDPSTARDFDDAISAERLDGGLIRIWVHIADVSAYVPEGSLVDREAMKRANSVYLPGRVEPMLPEALSNDACSLVPGEERAAVTVELDYRGAEVVRVSFTRSTIRSDKRLTYDKVDEIFAGTREAEAPWAEPLAAAREVAAALQARREEKPALELDSSEPEFAFNRDGHVKSVKASEHTESHRLIEHLMIAANEQVARHLETGGVPTLYRVHEQPSGESARKLVDQLESLGVPTPPVSDHLTGPEAADVVNECSRLVAEHARRTKHGRIGLTFLVLRALKQASYAPKNLGHAGLGLTQYLHFTSPIRRYPDLVAHRALLSTLGGLEPAPKASELEATGTHCSLRERDALSLERLADRVAQCFVLERELFRSKQREFDGEVTGVINAGAFVRFGGDHEGLLPIRRLTGDWWELNEQGTMLVGSSSERAIRIGDRIRVVVERIDKPRGRVDLSPVEPASRSERGRTRGSGRPSARR